MLRSGVAKQGAPKGYHLGQSSPLCVYCHRLSQSRTVSAARFCASFCRGLDGDIKPTTGAVTTHFCRYLIDSIRSHGKESLSPCDVTNFHGKINVNKFLDNAAMTSSVQKQSETVNLLSSWSRQYFADASRGRTTGKTTLIQWRNKWCSNCWQIRAT